MSDCLLLAGCLLVISKQVTTVYRLVEHLGGVEVERPNSGLACITEVGKRESVKGG